MGAVDAVHTIPNVAGHVSEQRMRVQSSVVLSVPLDRTGQRFDRFAEINLGHGSEIGVDRPAAGNALGQGDLEHPSANEEPLESVSAEIEALHRTDEALRKMVAYLP